MQLNHTQPDEVARVLEEGIAWRGRVDIAVNNAGGSAGNAPGDFFVREPDDIRRLVENNLLGPLYCSREIGRHMAGRGSGKIINIASMAGLMGRDRRMYERSGLREQPVEYAAAKAGVIGMTTDLAGLLSPRGICVNAISPGGFEARATRGLHSPVQRSYTARAHGPRRPRPQRRGALPGLSSLGLCDRPEPGCGRRLLDLALRAWVASPVEFPAPVGSSWVLPTWKMCVRSWGSPATRWGWRTWCG